MELNPSPIEKTTWDITMIGSDPDDEKIMQAVFPKNDQWRYSELEKGRIATAISPKSWKPLSQKHSTPLSQLIKKHDAIGIDFAITMDARKFVYGFTEVAKSVGAADDFGSISQVPTTRVSLVIGESSSSTLVDVNADLLGLAKLFSDIDAAKD